MNIKRIFKIIIVALISIPFVILIFPFFIFEIVFMFLGEISGRVLEIKAPDWYKNLSEWSRK